MRDIITFGKPDNVRFFYGTSYDVAPVSEPVKLLLSGSGLVGLAGIGRQRFGK